MLQENMTHLLIPKGKSRPSVAGTVLTCGEISSLCIPGLNLPLLLGQKGMFMVFLGLNAAAGVIGVLK